jgi:DNA-binding NtrC family response regulator
MPLELQARLLRVLQEREFQRVGSSETVKVDVRVIAASNCNLERRVEEGLFREDLYYRLNVIELKLPPLRERREDIPLLVEAFLKKCGDARGKAVKGVSEAALAMLMDYAWPGNVRELENVIERAVTLSRGEKISPDDLPPAVQGARGDRRVLDEAAEKALPLHEIEKEYIKKILEKTGGNKYQAAHALGIDRKTLYRKLAEIEGKPHPEE